jgi:hypothetical protein
MVSDGYCPRCGTELPLPLIRHAALSRVDNTTAVCSPCGMDEAMFEYSHRNEELPPLNERIVL